MAREEVPAHVRVVCDRCGAEALTTVGVNVSEATSLSDRIAVPPPAAWRLVVMPYRSSDAEPITVVPHRHREAVDLCSSCRLALARWMVTPAQPRSVDVDPLRADRTEQIADVVGAVHGR